MVSFNYHPFQSQPPTYLHPRASRREFRESHAPTDPRRWGKEVKVCWAPLLIGVASESRGEEKRLFASRKLRRLIFPRRRPFFQQMDRQAELPGGRKERGRGWQRGKQKERERTRQRKTEILLLARCTSGEEWRWALELKAAFLRTLLPPRLKRDGERRRTRRGRERAGGNILSDPFKVHTDTYALMSH